jgi:hypothetical protein
MHGRRALLCFLLLATSLVPTGCGVPLKVVRIDDPTLPVEGVRYYLRRPKYVLGLRLHDPESTKIFDVLGRTPVDFKAGIAIHEGAGVPVDLVQPQLGSELCVDEGATFDLRLSQTMDGHPVLYEVRQPPFYAKPLHAFSDTNFTITLDEPGTLSALSAGEADKTLEFVQAVSGLAVSVAKGIVKPAVTGREEPFRCHVVLEGDSKRPDSRFQEYLREHRRLSSEKSRGLEARDALERAISGGDPKEIGEALAALAILDQRLERTEARLQAIQYPIPS